ncbi:unnamed protein product [Symbiodinium natans]|uniref:Uncharacterized protein n=1 Tax=Symbiodinium natans TaxID=878477 RepID=A0A812M2A9_9DINO|nr:unnamed protein product [Symbiodinium natans]
MCVYGSLNPPKQELLQASAENNAGCQCAPNPTDYENKNPGAKVGRKAAKAAAFICWNFLSMAVKTAVEDVVPYEALFNVVTPILTNFFPEPSEKRPNPCHDAEAGDWGKCVWQQVQPFVQKYVAHEINGVFDELWQAHILGFGSTLRDIWTVLEGSASQDRFDHYMQSLYHVFNNMNEIAPEFFTDPAMTTTKGIYLEQFAALHISVMSVLFGAAKRFRSSGHRIVFQRHILCYAKQVFMTTTKAKEDRLRKITDYTDQPYTIWCNLILGLRTPCGETDPPGTHWSDAAWGCSAEGTCAWHCVEQAAGQKCPAWPTCTNGEKYLTQPTQHKNCVAEQLNKFWASRLMAVPYWLMAVMEMQHVNVTGTALPEGPLICDW